MLKLYPQLILQLPIQQILNFKLDSNNYLPENKELKMQKFLPDCFPSGGIQLRTTPIPETYANIAKPTAKHFG